MCSCRPILGRRAGATSVRNDAVRTVSDMHRVALAMHGSAMLYEAAIAAEIFGVDRSELSPERRVVRPRGLHRRRRSRTPGCRTCRPRRTPRSPTSTPSSCRPPTTSTRSRTRSSSRRCAWRTSAACGSRRCAPVPSCWRRPGSSTAASRPRTGCTPTTLARRYPQVDVRADVLYIDEGDVLTSAGKTAALDLCIHLVRRDLGAAAANGIARRLVVPAHRSGGQAQFITPPAEPRSPDGLAPTLRVGAGPPRPAADRARPRAACRPQHPAARPPDARRARRPVRSTGCTSSASPGPGAPRAHRRLRRADRRQLRHGHRGHPAPALPPRRRRVPDGVPGDVPPRLSRPAERVRELRAARPECGARARPGRRRPGRARTGRAPSTEPRSARRAGRAAAAR